VIIFNSTEPRVGVRAPVVVLVGRAEDCGLEKTDLPREIDCHGKTVSQSISGGNSSEW
jgi:hypothetical protein